MIGRKQNTPNDVWVKIVSNIEKYVTKQEVEELTEKAIFEIQTKAQKHNAVYAWSGGKDSIVLSELCHKAGVTSSFGILTQLEYPAFDSWIEEHKPAGCKIIRTKHDLEWLSNNQDKLFPPMSYSWGNVLQRPGQKKYCKANNYDLLILGRRTAEGNFVGIGTNKHSSKKGLISYNPIAYWTHEQLLGYIHYNNLELPPIYKWKNGYKAGTHPWYLRPYIDGDMQKGWQELFEIDPSIIAKAAEYIESARVFLEGVS